MSEHTVMRTWNGAQTFPVVAQIESLSNPWARIPALAERLGVEPNENNRDWVITVDGKKYCCFALINAVLNRLDAFEKGTNAKV